MQRQHPRVTIRKVRSTLRMSGLPNEIQQAILNKIGGAAQNRLVKIPRPVQKRISEALSSDGKCGLYLTSSGRIYVAGGASVTFTGHEAGRANLVKSAQERPGYSKKKSGPHLTPEQKKAMINEIHAGGFTSQQLAFKYGVHMTTVARFRRELREGTLHPVEAVAS